MTSVIVALPKIEDAKSMKNVLVRDGVSVAGACITGAQVLALADSYSDGIVICGYKMADMMYSRLQEYLPSGFEILLLASRQVISEGIAESGVMCLTMPVKVHDLVNTVDMMIQAAELRKRKRREKPRERSAKETGLIKDAKEVLMRRNHMTEEEAHRYIQKCSMDSGTNMVETAQMVLRMMK